MKHANEQNQDEVFLQELRQIVLDNLENEQFSVAFFSKEAGVSRSHLHRKLKALKGQSISKFIRQIRLEEAMKLLQNNVANTSEVAFRVGFSSTSYFITCFNAFYGFPPGQVKKQMLEQNIAEASATEAEIEKSPDEEENLKQEEKTESDAQVKPVKKPTIQSLGLKKILVSSALFLAIILLVVIFFYPVSLNAGAKGQKAIAVLPLSHTLGDPEQEYLALGMQDALINALGQLSALRVISRTSTMRYRQSNKLLSEIAKELEVDAIVEGSVLGLGDSVNIQLQLIEAFPQERHLWAQQYAKDLRTIQSEQINMVNSIAREIQVSLSPQEETRLAQMPTANSDAYKAYLKGMFYWEKLTEEDLNTAMSYFELALDIDPDYALAYAGVSLVWVGRMQQGLSSYFEGGSNIKIAEVKRRLLEIGRDIPEIHYALGVKSCWVEWNYEEAEKELKQAIALNPNHSNARAYLSHVLNILHKPEEAMEQIETALQLDPFNPLLQALYGMDMLYARQFDKAINLLSKTLETAPTDPVALSTLRTAYHMKDMYPEALDIWITSYAAKEDQTAIEALMRGNRSGGYHTALESLAQTLIARSDSIYVTPWQIGTLYTRAGKKEEALAWLEKAYKAHDSNMPYIGVDPIFDYLWDDKRFQALLKKMNLPMAKHPLAR